MSELIYRIKDWEKHYECSETRKVKSFSRFLPLSNRMDTSGFAALMNHPNGAAHYGAWVCLLSMASKADPRGSLVRSGGRALSVSAMSAVSRIPVSVFEELLPRLLSEEIDWLEVVDQQGNCVTATSPFHHSGIHSTTVECTILEERRGEESREQDRTGEENPHSPPKGELWLGLIPESLKVCQESIGEWIAYKAERGKKYKPRGLKGLMTQLTEWGPQRTAAAIRHSIACNYDGVFEPRAGPGKPQGNFYGGLLDFVEGGTANGSG